MNLAYIVISLIVLLFGFVVFFGAPYLPTLGKQQETALDMLALRPGQTLLELGCGDGKVLAAAARRGIKAVGYELNPILALVAWLRTRRYGGLVTVHFGNFWRKDWPPTDGIFVFLLDKYMDKLHTNIIQKYKGQKIKLVSFAFEVPAKKPALEREGLFLYRY